MTTEAGKPLPRIPKEVKPITALSLNARAHRANFLRWFLQNEGGVEEDYMQEWINVFEDALDALGESVGQGKWLSSAWANKRAAETQPDGGNDDKGPATDERRHVPDLASDGALQQIRARIASPLSSSAADGFKHLVLCLSGPGNLRDDEEGGFDFLASNIGCIFRSGHFNPNDSNVSFLYGIDTWDTRGKGELCPSKYVSLNQSYILSRYLENFYQLVGGTFAFKGVASRSQYTKLAKVLRVCIYFQLSMIIEQQLLLDFGLSISVPSRPPIRQITSSYAETFSPTPKYSGNLPGTFLSFIQKKGVGLFRSRKQSGPVASTPVRTGSLDISPTTNTSSPNLKEPRKRRISFMPTSPATLPVLQALQEPSKQYHFFQPYSRIGEIYVYVCGCSISSAKIVRRPGFKRKGHGTRRQTNYPEGKR
jgi:hypothetical protein